MRPPRRAAGGSGGPGHVLIWPGRAIYVGPLLEHDAHAHHAIQLSIALAESLSVQAPPDRRWRTFRAVATAPDQPHRLRCDGPIAQIYLDPESAAGAGMLRRIGDRGVAVAAVDVDDREALAAGLRPAGGAAPDPERALRLVDALVGDAAPDPSATPIDPRVQKALSTIHALGEPRISLGALAEHVALSPSRLGALFRRDIGIPVRRYLLWVRLIHAVEALAGGADLTQAAHGAGFADSAHFTRTFRRMFGMPPSTLRAHAGVQDFAAGSRAAPWWATPPALVVGAGGSRAPTGGDPG